MKVMKFGGGCLRNQETVLLTANIIKAQREQVAIVVSAVYGITDKLIEAIQLVKEDEKNIPTLITSLEEEHFFICDQIIDKKSLKHDCRKKIKIMLSDLTKLLFGISYTGEVTHSIKSQVLSYGERLSALLLSMVLNQIGKRAIDLSAAEIGVIVYEDDVFDNATADLERIKQNFKQSVLPWLNQGVIPVITGYFGRSKEGKISTFGRNGSDYSAAVIASGIKADSLELWKDVDGFMSADPSIVNDVRKIDYISFQEAAELSYFGAKLLHPRTTDPLAKSGIGLCIMNIHDSENTGTLIGPQGYEKEGIIKSVTYNREIAVLRVQGSGVGFKPGIIANIGSVLADEGINIYSIVTSQTCINLLIDKKDATPGLEILRKIKEGVVEKVKLYNNKALIAVVGQGLLKKEGIAASVFSAVSEVKINIEMISAGASEVATYFIVRDTDLVEAVRAIHNRFFNDQGAVNTTHPQTPVDK